MWLCPHRGEVSSEEALWLRLEDAARRGSRNDLRQDPALLV